MDEPKKVLKYSIDLPLQSLSYFDIATASSKLKAQIVDYTQSHGINFLGEGGYDENIEVYHYDDDRYHDDQMGVMFSAEYINPDYDKQLAEYNLWHEKRRLELQVNKDKSKMKEYDYLQRKNKEETESFNRFKALINRMINERSTFGFTDSEVLDRISKMVQHCK